MKNIQYSSLYKFIVAIGIAMIAVPVVLLFAIFNYNDVLLLPEAEIDMLTETSQQIINAKQGVLFELFDTWIGFVTAIGVLFIVLGVILVVVAFYRWGKVQRVRERKLYLKNEKLEKEIGMSVEERKVEAEREIEKDTEGLDESISKKVVTPRDYIKIEDAVARKIAKDLQNSHDVVKGARIGRYSYDIVATGRGFYEKDYFYEVKYVKYYISKMWIKKVTLHALDLMENYKTLTGRIPHVRIVIVTNIYDSELKELVEQFARNNFQFKVLSRDEINKTDFKN